MCSCFLRRNENDKYIDNTANAIRCNVTQSTPHHLYRFIFLLNARDLEIGPPARKTRWVGSAPQPQIEGDSKRTCLHTKQSRPHSIIHGIGTVAYKQNQDCSQFPINPSSQFWPETTMNFSTTALANNHRLLLLAAASVGTASILSTLLRFSHFTWSYFLRSSNLRIYLHTKQNEGGSWALVTGASDGIGYAFAEELLNKGFNVLLHGRNAEKLNRIQAELKARFPSRSIETVVADASAHGHPEDAVVAKAKELPGKLTILVNNVGGNATRPGCSPLADFPREHAETCINLNARFPLQLTRALIPTLEKSTPSLIINCGSGAAAGIPYLATYSATKGFIHSFTTALRKEFTRHDAPGRVEVIGFVIGNVMSASNRISLPAVTISAAQCARGCLERVGCGETVTCAHWKHAFAMWFLGLLPGSTVDGILMKATEDRMEGERKGQ